MRTAKPRRHPVPSLDMQAFFASDSPCRSVPGLAFWELDLASRQVSYAPDWDVSLGLKAGPQPGADLEWWWQRVYEKDKAAFRKACVDCAAGNRPVFEITLRILRMDAKTAWLQVKGKALLNASGFATRIAGYVSDVTNLRADQHFLPHMDDDAETYRAMLENSPDMIVRFDRNFLPLYANRATSRYLNINTPSLGPGLYDEVGIAWESRVFLRRCIVSVFADGGIIKETVSVHSAVRGQVTAEFYFGPEFAPDGTVRTVICQVRDRSAQTRMEQALRLNEERLDALYRLTQMQEAPEREIIGFVLEQIALLTRSRHSYLFFPGAGKGGRGRIHWSQSMQDLVGAAALPTDTMPHECCGREHGFHGEVTAPCFVNISDEEGGHEVFGVLTVKRYILLPVFEDNRVVCIASVCNKDKDYDEADLRQMQLFINGVWLVLRRTRSVHDLKTAKEAAEEASRVKSQFLANVSHELRTPLNGMLGMLQLLQLSPLSEEQRGYAQAAGLSGETLLRIISDILDYSRMESGKMDLAAAPFDLRATLLSTMALFAAEADRKGLDVAVRLDDNLPRALLGDDARVRQIVFNLVGNALKFTEAGGIALECSLLGHTAKGKAWVYFAVRDTGIGIPAHAHGAVFDAFTQLDTSRTRKYPGTGLGLGIVKRLVRMMGGTLALDSEVGEGTAVHCVLPFERAGDLQARRRGPAGHSDESLDILVAEDDPVSRFAVQSFLRRTKHRVVCVTDGMQALEALRLHPFDCLFTDIQMPFMDGLELVRRIRQGASADVTPGPAAVAAVAAVIPGVGPDVDPERLAAVPRDLQVTALTAHAMTGDKELFLDMGMDMYLSKPIDMEELHAVLARMAKRSPPGP
ncbi:putative Histidine kinase [uncultured delta proteobacterium]|uniref:histidine kinase n=1 Tax=uncultured delta proteobacterium TaxID=34034 RepID=A0A212JNA3_9DELT|nr:putative Histidine kinase [uncultured delta proteobacterium]